MRGVRVVTMMPMGESPYAQPEPGSYLDLYTFFPGKGLRAAVNANQARALRHPLSALPGLFDTRTWRADALFLQVSSPDEDGLVSLGISVDYMRAVLSQRPLVVAEINPRMPRTCGDTLLHVSEIDWFIEAKEAPQSVEPARADAVDDKIAHNVAGLLFDGAVLQLGIGTLPDRVAANLTHLRKLGLHSGIITDAVRPLIESGSLDNSTKRFKPGVCVTAMAGGTQSFYDFLHRNPTVEFHPCSITHDAQVLAGIDGLCAINSVLQVDLQGRANAETVGGRRISLPGGLPDFASGSRRAKDGLSILAVRSTAGRNAASSIVANLDGNMPTLVADQIDYVVTEYGIAPMHVGNASNRADALIGIAHPDHREELARQVHGHITGGLINTV